MKNWSEKDDQNNLIEYEKNSNITVRKIQPPSPMFDRYPKPCGNLKVYDITTPDKDVPVSFSFFSTQQIDKMKNFM